MTRRLAPKPGDATRDVATTAGDLPFPPPFVPSFGRALDPDEPITPKLSARIWPGREDALDVSAVYRFMQPGIGGLRLACMKVPGTGRVTTWRWICEFISAVSAKRGGAG